MAIGRKTGGRQKGTPNRRTQEVAQFLAGTGFDPIEAMTRIAMGKLPCTVCKGKRRRKQQPEVCPHCYGRGLEIVTIELRARMCAELAQYVYPKLRAVEHTGPGGGPVEVIEILQRRLNALKRTAGGGNGEGAWRRPADAAG